MSEAPMAALNSALARAVAKAKAVGKDATNKFHNYKYASAEAIIEEAREALSAEGLAVMPVSCDRDPGQPAHVWIGEGDKAEIDIPRRMRIVYRLTHASGESVEISSSCPVLPGNGRPEDKAEFGARTENLGYLLRDLLCLPRVDAEIPSARDDSNYQQPRRPPAPPKKQPQQASPPKSNGTAKPERVIGEDDGDPVRENLEVDLLEMQAALHACAHEDEHKSQHKAIAALRKRMLAANWKAGDDKLTTAARESWERITGKPAIPEPVGAKDQPMPEWGR